MTETRCASLGELAEFIGDCHRCPLGYAGRTQVVFGAGDPGASVIIVGEAPGKNEDIRGEPFVGAAGKYLDELLGEAGLERAGVYIANIVKCRPPGNRDPEAIEIETCTPFLREQIRLIAPSVIVTLGNFATKFILKTDTGITRLHGTLHETGAVTVMPMYHPAAAIYDRTKQPALAEDFRALGALLGARGLVRGPSSDGGAPATESSDRADLDSAEESQDSQATLF